MVGLVFVRVERGAFFVDGDFLVSYDCRLLTFGCFVLRVIEEVFCSLYSDRGDSTYAVDFTPERFDLPSPESPLFQELYEN